MKPQLKEYVVKGKIIREYDFRIIVDAEDEEDAKYYAKVAIEREGEGAIKETYSEATPTEAKRINTI